MASPCERFFRHRPSSDSRALPPHVPAVKTRSTATPERMLPKVHVVGHPSLWKTWNRHYLKENGQKWFRTHDRETDSNTYTKYEIWFARLLCSQQTQMYPISTPGKAILRNTATKKVAELFEVVSLERLWRAQLVLPAVWRPLRRPDAHARRNARGNKRFVVMAN